MAADPSPQAEALQQGWCFGAVKIEKKIKQSNTIGQVSQREDNKQQAKDAQSHF